MIDDQIKKENLDFTNQDVSKEKSNDSLDWAKKAYQRLKKEQEERKLNDKELNQSNIVNESFEVSETSKNNIVNEDPILGDFDNKFAWSADILAAQGKKSDDISIDEIDWLGRLRQGLEKSRKAFVTDLLDKFGDDPLTPEVVDDLEMLL